MYLIYWTSKITGKAGHGTVKYTYAEALAICQRLNKDVPDLYHWPQKPITSHK